MALYSAKFSRLASFRAILPVMSRKAPTDVRPTGGRRIAQRKAPTSNHNPAHKHQDRPERPLEAPGTPVRGLAVPSKVRHTTLALGGRDLVEKLGQGATAMRQGGGSDAVVSIGYGLAWAKKAAVYTLGVPLFVLVPPSLCVCLCWYGSRLCAVRRMIL